ncbi:hypothetical protein DSO57_1035195 [Entomophthora muscae]|uniref:Uncharacterized protein n=1 Tax=Entomophthora muscae TaxID=34485 RepID=A0ACC2TY91_9FUNG|nr:hypothetical protein DSO57_1035195 [Entomophthora muscae]
MRLPKTPLIESLGYKWLFWIVLLTTVLASTLMGSRADLGTTPESQSLDSSWRHVIPGVWYTATPLSPNPPVQEETKIYGSTTQVPEPQVFCSLASAFLLCYLGAYFFLGCFNPLLGRYQIFGELFHLGMVSLPVGYLVNGLNPSAIIHHLERLLPSEWVPDKWLQIEGSTTALEAIQGRGHQASVYPTSHAEIHLADLVLSTLETQYRSAALRLSMTSILVS